MKLMSASVSLSSSAPGNLLPLKALCTGQRVVVVVARVAVSSDGKFVAAIAIEGRQTTLGVFLCNCTIGGESEQLDWLAPFKC